MLFLASTAGDIADFVVGYAAAGRKFGIATCADAYCTYYRQLVADIRRLHSHLAHVVELRASVGSLLITSAIIFVNSSFYIVTAAVNNNHAIQSIGRTCGNCCANAVNIATVGCIYIENTASIIIHAADFAAFDIRASGIVQGIVGNS